MIGTRSLAPAQLGSTIPVPKTEAAPRPLPVRPRGAKPAAARRALLSFAAAFAVATAGFGVALDTALPTLRYPEHGYRLAALRRLRAEYPDRPLVVALGSSRTQMGFDPGAMGFADEPGGPVVFNGALVGALPVHHPLAYRRLRAAGVKPDAVVVEIFPALLYVRDASETLYADRGANLTGAELWRLRADTHHPRTALAWGKARFNPWGTFRREFQQQALPDWLPGDSVRWYNVRWVPDRFGFQPFGADQVSDDVRRHATDTQTDSYRPICRQLSVCPLAERAHRELVAACRADGVPVAFFLSPEAPLFHGWYTPESRAALADFVRTLTDELGAPVFDLSDGWDEMDFADGHHMLPAGSKKFSRRFAAQHLRPWFAALWPQRQP